MAEGIREKLSVGSYTSLAHWQYLISYSSKKNCYFPCFICYSSKTNCYFLFHLLFLKKELLLSILGYLVSPRCVSCVALECMRSEGYGIIMCLCPVHRFPPPGALDPEI